MTRQRWIATSVALLVLIIGCGQLVQSVPEPELAKVEQLVRKARQISQDHPNRNAEKEDPTDSPIVGYPDWGLEQAAADALSRIGKAAVPALARAMKSGDSDGRVKAAKVLARIGPAASPAVAELAEALDDDDPELRKAAARALGQIGPDAAAAVPQLMELLNSSPTNSADSSQTQ